MRPHADGKWGDVEPLAVGAERNAAAAEAMIKTILGGTASQKHYVRHPDGLTDATSSTWRSRIFNQIQTEVAFVHSVSTGGSANGTRKINDSPLVGRNVCRHVASNNFGRAIP